MPIAPGFTAITPGGILKVGHLYFSGRGKYPAFTDSSGRLFSEFCWRDYLKDAVLKDIERFVEVQPDPLTAYRGGADASFALGVPNIASASGSAKADATVSGIKRLTLNAEGLEAVLANLGETCRAQIPEYLKSYDVVLLISAQRADSMKLSADARLDLEVAAGKALGLNPPKVGVHGEQALDYQMVYLSASLGSTNPGEP
ncbi:hypothetical protein [Devosia sp. FKR38]|uniref:hypothetical protein n=1 Tax=Devosia sp. FKR38 TaxID=2562312 RepID=UPI0010C0ED83|nr:hypothetical protein [Devosia sp. FKR38]